MTATIFIFDNVAQNSTLDNVMRMPLIRGATSVLNTKPYSANNVAEFNLPLGARSTQDNVMRMPLIRGATSALHTKPYSANNVAEFDLPLGARSTQDNVMRMPLIRGATSVAYAYTRARRNKVGRAFP